MYGALRPILFRLDPERAHRLAVGTLAAAQRGGPARALLPHPGPPSPRLAMGFLGARVPGPLGMAAGFDKEARCYNALLRLGFGHAEVGTLTPRPQPGNPRPRMHRLAAERALVNSLGFPNPGVEAAARRLARRPPAGLVGANIGPNKDTPPERVAADLVACAWRLAPHVAYLAVNVSSPNTPGLRAHQTPAGIARLVAAVREGLDGAAPRRPVLVKLHPDAPDGELAAVARAAVDAGAAGILAVNTTRQPSVPIPAGMQGGLSGAPLHRRAVAAVSAIHAAVGDRVPVVGIGGVFSGADTLRMVRAGATLVQAYTGFVYRGPRFAALAHHELVGELDRAGLDRLDEALGVPA